MAASGLTILPQKALGHQHIGQRETMAETNPTATWNLTSIKSGFQQALWYLLNLMHYSTLGHGLVQVIRSHHYRHPQVGQDDDTQCQHQSSNPCVGKHQHTHTLTHAYTHAHIHTYKRTLTHTCTHTHIAVKENDWEKYPALTSGLHMCTDTGALCSYTCMQKKKPS